MLSRWRSERRKFVRSDEGLALETSAFESPNGTGSPSSVCAVYCASVMAVSLYQTGLAKGETS